jgi:hypothetical protein
MFPGESFLDKRRYESATAGVPSLWSFGGRTNAAELLGTQHLRYYRTPSGHEIGVDSRDRWQIGIILHLIETGALASLATLHLPGEFETVRSEETLDRLRVVCRERRVQIVYEDWGTHDWDSLVSQEFWKACREAKGATEAV